MLEGLNILNCKNVIDFGVCVIFYELYFVKLVCKVMNVLYN